MAATPLPQHILDKFKEFCLPREQAAFEKGKAAGREEILSGLNALRAFLPPSLSSLHANTPTLAAVAAPIHMGHPVGQPAQSAPHDDDGEFDLDELIREVAGSDPSERQHVLLLAIAAIREAYAARGEDPTPVVNAIKRMAANGGDRAALGSEPQWMGWKAAQTQKGSVKAVWDGEGGIQRKPLYSKQAEQALRAQTNRANRQEAGQQRDDLVEKVKAKKVLTPEEVDAFDGHLKHLSGEMLKQTRQMLQEHLEGGVRAGKNKLQRATAIKTAVARLIQHAQDNPEEVTPDAEQPQTLPADGERRGPAETLVPDGEPGDGVGKADWEEGMEPPEAGGPGGWVKHADYEPGMEPPTPEPKTAEEVAMERTGGVRGEGRNRYGNAQTHEQFAPAPEPETLTPDEDVPEAEEIPIHWQGHGESTNREGYTQKTATAQLGAKPERKPDASPAQSAPAPEPEAEPEAAPAEPKPEAKADGPTKAPWEMSPEELKQSGTKFFRTAKGSLYAVHPKTGQTIRVKSDHTKQGHDAKDVGIKGGSHKTVYVPKDKAAALSTAGLSGPDGKVRARVSIKDGKATLITHDPKTNKWGSTKSGTGVTISHEPGAGLAPLELWDKKGDVPGHEDAYGTMHAGNEITGEVSPEEAHGHFVNAAKAAGKKVYDPAEQPAAKTEPKPEVKPEPKAEKPAAQPKGEDKAAAKPQPKPAAKPQSTAEAVKAGFDGLASGIKDASDKKTAADVQKQGHTAFRKEAAADAFAKQNPDWTRTRVGDEHRFAPPAPKAEAKAPDAAPPAQSAPQPETPALPADHPSSRAKDALASLRTDPDKMTALHAEAVAGKHGPLAAQEAAKAQAMAGGPNGSKELAAHLYAKYLADHPHSVAPPEEKAKAEAAPQRPAGTLHERAKGASGLDAYDLFTEALRGEHGPEVKEKAERLHAAHLKDMNGVQIAERFAQSVGHAAPEPAPEPAPAQSAPAAEKPAGVKGADAPAAKPKAEEKDWDKILADMDAAEAKNDRKQRKIKDALSGKPAKPKAGSPKAEPAPEKKAEPVTPAAPAKQEPAPAEEDEDADLRRELAERRASLKERRAKLLADPKFAVPDEDRPKSEKTVTRDPSRPLSEAELERQARARVDAANGETDGEAGPTAADLKGLEGEADAAVRDASGKYSPDAPAVGDRTKTASEQVDSAKEERIKAMQARLAAGKGVKGEDLTAADRKELADVDEAAATEKSAAPKGKAGRPTKASKTAGKPLHERLNNDIRKGELARAVTRHRADGFVPPPSKKVFDYLGVPDTPELRQEWEELVKAKAAEKGAAPKRAGKKGPPKGE
jgi:hypothetical protein